jgi:hypothetical protein
VEKVADMAGISYLRKRKTNLLTIKALETMETKVTIMRHYHGKQTMRLMGIDEVVETIRSCKYKKEVANFRRVYPLVKSQRGEDGTIAHFDPATKALPRVCFALEMLTRGENRLVRSYSGLVLLEVNNLRGQDEAAAVRHGAAEMPQTLAAFVGADGQSVKIVCRGELFPSPYDRGRYLRPEEAPLLPIDEQEVRDFHQNLYERARIIYNGQLGVTIEKLEPLPERVCYMAADEQIAYNPLATTIYAHAEEVTDSNITATTDRSTTEETSLDNIVSIQSAYEFNLSKALDDAEGIRDENIQRHMVLTKLAHYCEQTGIPMALARRMAAGNAWLGTDRLLVEKVFENAYRREHSRRYRAQKQLELTGHIPSETLLTMKIDLFLRNNYDLRRNVLRGVAEYRERKGLGFAFRDLTEEARNSITMRALEQGIKCWDKDIRRYVNSNDISLYDPINDYLEHLAPWDGKDRLEALARRVPTGYKEWPYLFHIWMRSVVAMWLGKGQLTGNALVPLLIGRQGCGKSSFCRILLPHELDDYYNDRINFKNESDLNLGLTSFALINLDEFDKITQRQQIVLKYLVSTADLRYRPPYGKAYTVNRRYASFIGTTNDPTPLVDPTGSRRFICVAIDGDIDFETPVYHDQLYAQLKEEITQGERYWLTKEEERQLMEHNLQYQRLNGLGEMLMSIVQRPRDGEEGTWLSLQELSALLRKHFKGYQEDPGSFHKIGNYLNRPEYKFKSRRSHKGTLYWVMLRI